MAVDAPVGVPLDPLDEVQPLDTPVRRRRRVTFGMALAVGWLSLIIFLAIFATVLPFEDPRVPHKNQARKPPSWAHWLGTDQLSRDMLARIVYGARISILVAVVSALLAGIIGSMLGLVAGYFRRTTETLIMGFMDVMLAVPALLLVITLTTFLKPGVRNIIVAIAVLGVPSFARVIRAQTLTYADRDFVRAARVLGATRRRILFREIAPNIAPTIAAYFLVTMSLAIVVEGALSFLNLSVSRERATWGGMINDGRSNLKNAPHITFIPSIVLVVTVLSLNALGERILRRQQRSEEPTA